MITKSKQEWEVGQTVKVGFLSGLVVKAKIISLGDFGQMGYILCRNEQLYKFVPHGGLERLSFGEARELLAESKAVLARRAAIAAAEVTQSARAKAQIDTLFGA
jgi:hypothetical protein